MKIGEALAEKKRLQSRLAKCYKLLESSFYYHEKPDFSYDKLRTEIDELLEKIKDLKLRIIKTNLELDVEVEGKTISLTELIIEIGDTRSKISAFEDLYKNKDDWYDLRDDNVIKKSQVEPEKIEDEIKQLSKRKTKLDSLLQNYNWTEELIN